MPARIRRPRTLPRLASGAAVLALGLAGLTACGGSDSGSSCGRQLDQRVRGGVEQRGRVVVRPRAGRPRRRRSPPPRRTSASRWTRTP